MKKHLLLAALALTSVQAQNRTISSIDTTFTINGVERPFITVKAFYAPLIELEIKLRGQLAKLAYPQRSQDQDIFNWVHNEKIDGMKAVVRLRLKQITLMERLTALGFEEKLVTTLNEFYNDGNIKFIVNTLEKKCDNQIAEACFEAAILEKDRFELETAENFFAKAHKINPKSSKYTAYLGQSQLQNNNYALAEETLKQGINLEDTSHKYKAMFHLSGYYGFAQRAEQKMELMQQIIRDADKITSEEDRRYLTKVMIETANIAHKSRKMSEALALADRAVAMGLDHFPDAEIENVATGYFNMAHIYADNKRKEEAEKLYKISVKIGEAYYVSRPHSKLAQRYFNLAYFYMEDERYEEALLYQNKALRIMNSGRLEGGDIGMSGWYVGIAINHLHLKNEKEAETNFLLARDEFKKNKDSSSQSYILYVQSYGGLLMHLGRKNEAENLVKTIETSKAETKNRVEHYVISPKK